MNPLEDIVVALQPVSQSLPFPLPDSIRSLDPTMPDGVQSRASIPLLAMRSPVARAHSTPR